MTLVKNKTERDTFLRSKNRFFIAGWVASECNEPPQAFTGNNIKFQEYYENYLDGYRCELSNSEALATGFN